MSVPGGGRIRDADIVLVREQSRIDDVVRDYVSLKPAGGGSFKGLCPFHDERTPSFHVTPARGYFYCFGCQEGGDAISFLMRLEHLSFSETVERLADRFGIQLHYEQGSAGMVRQVGAKKRSLEANEQAAAFFQYQLSQPGAQAARAFLQGRGFSEELVADFGVGYAPSGWDNLTDALRKRGFSHEELLTAGLVSQGNRGVYDRFRNRVVWPIRDMSGDMVGFGARKLDEAEDSPKYLNTPETPAYKKSQVLFGIDRARREIAATKTVVVVEGYTDVMAAHAAGVPQAVATCGTAFGADHIRVLRRLMLDEDRLNGKIIFTFDGDAAGQQAALRAFEHEHQFVAQTYIAVAQEGMDPCDLRLAQGDQAVRDLVASAVPLIQFVIKTRLAQFDLNTAEGQAGALQAAAPLVAQVQQTALRQEYVRKLAGWLGREDAEVARAVQHAGKNRARESSKSVTREGWQDAPAQNMAAPQMRGSQTLPVPQTLAERVEYRALQCILQAPEMVGQWFDVLENSAFTTPAYANLFHIMRSLVGQEEFAVTLGQIGSGMAWGQALQAASENDTQRQLIVAATVDAVDTDEIDTSYVQGIFTKLLDLDAERRIQRLRSQHRRAEAAELDGEQPPGGVSAQNLFEHIMALEGYRRDLQQQSRQQY